MIDFVSIIIPTFNRASIIGKAIQSVLDQSLPRWELIIIDDGSTDDTLNTIEAYLEDKRIKYFYQQNQGVSVARNLGVKKSIGNHLIFLDSDDFFFSYLLQNLNEAKFWDYDLICWQVLKIIDGKKSIWKPKRLSGMYNHITASFLAGSICYRKDLFYKAGGYDPKMTNGQNYELGMRVSQRKDLKIKVLNKIFLQYEPKNSARSINSIKTVLISYFYQYKKHKLNYDKNPKAKAELYYIFGFGLQKVHKKTAALTQYKNSLRTNPWRLKPYVKVLYLYIFK